MTWRPPNDLERFLLTDTRARWPEIIPLARLLVLAPRIEPLLLRNARRHFLPGAAVEIESQLWFSPLVAARSTREIVLHLGIARVLAGQFGGSQPWPGDAGMEDGVDLATPPDLTDVWSFTRDHTRHWPAEDRLERDLRYHALRGDDTALAGGLRAILAQIVTESGSAGDQARSISLARLAKHTLPTIRSGFGRRSAETATLLARYAALALGDGGDWSAAHAAGTGAPEVLPAWLQERLPPPLAQTRLGVEIRWDDIHGQALHFVDTRDGEPAIDLPSPLPGRLHVAPGGQAGDWHAVTRGTCLPIYPPSAALRLTTLDGCQWDLVTDALPLGPQSDSTPSPLLLVHVAADLEQANVIATWLRGQGIPVELMAETPHEGGIQSGPTPARLVRLWTRAARDLWVRAGAEPPQDQPQGLLLRTESVDAPAAGTAAGQILDWQDWQRLADSPKAAALLQILGGWWREGHVAEFELGSTGPGAAPNQTPEGGESPTAPDELTISAEDASPKAEIGRLLAEVSDPETEPPRRLAIGDRLAEFGDPRPGVGTVEIKVEIEPQVDPTPLAETVPEWQGETQTIHIAPPYSPAVQALVEAILDPAITPPRRLEVGDDLAALGDPRPGVGLRADGLPDIAWVEITRGSFVYQDGEPRELPTYWMARYPVTNAQYHAFIDDDGYKNRRWWSDLKKPEPRLSQLTRSQRPRTDVDWYETVAFTRWLSARLELPEGALRLPTELEWEKAARGKKGLIYPWGNAYKPGFANVDETHGKPKGRWYLKQTTAVGLYPHGRSPYGVEDLSGTVWEWCLNQYDDLAAIGPDNGSASRALRGGSWRDNPDRARTSSRLGLLPLKRDVFRGFRLLLSIPIEPLR